MIQVCKKIVIFILCIQLTGCGSNLVMSLSDKLPIVDSMPLATPAKPEKIGIYLDVTPSMEGFLGMETDEYEALVPETRYEICLDAINKILARQYSGDQLNFYRVDTPMWKTEENVLKEAGDKKYYRNSKKNNSYEKVDLIENDGEDYDSLCLTNALINCREDDLSILITDFHENTGAKNGDEVIQALKQNMEEKTIGIVGIRSEFAGTVYDYDLEGGQVEYGVIETDILPENICYRQFYIIVIGQAEVVQEFCKNLQEDVKIGEDDIKSTVFYKDEIYGMDYSSFKECLTRSNSRTWKLWPNGEIKINDNGKMDIYNYCNKSGEEKYVVTCYKVEGQTLKEELERGIKCTSVLSELQTLDLVEVPYYMEGKAASLWDSEEACFRVDTDLLDVYSVEHLYYSAQTELLYLVFCVTENNLPVGPIKLSGEIHLECQETLSIEWINDWDFANDNRNYCKTRELKRYTDAIVENMPERNDLLVDFAFYLNILK